MGLLNRKDATIFRNYFSEMVKLIGQSVAYQYVVKQNTTIHSEENDTFSTPQRIDVLFEENPTVDTLNRIGWTVELNDQKPIIVYLPYDTPKLTVDARITVESVDGVKRPRVFRITKIGSDLEYPEAFACVITPVFDQFKQRNQYTLVNHEKISTEESRRTSEDQPYKYITNSQIVDNTPKANKDFENSFKFINDKSSPYSS